MADALGRGVGAFLGEHHRVDEGHDELAIDVRYSQRELTISCDAARRAEGLHGFELLRRVDFQLSQDPSGDEPESEISATAHPSGHENVQRRFEHDHASFCEWQHRSDDVLAPMPGGSHSD